MCSDTLVAAVPRSGDLARNVLGPSEQHRAKSLMSSRATQQIVQDALSEATMGAEPGSTAADVLQQFVGRD